jgi:hypothetical protein
MSINGGDRRGAFGGGNLMKDRRTLNSAMYKNEDGGLISSSNLKRIFSVGLAFNSLQKANELVGSYTEDRLRQRRMDVNMTFAKYGIGVMVNPAIGGIYAASDMGYRAAQYGIKIQKGSREADYYRRLSGNNSFSGSRYMGDLV